MIDDLWKLGKATGRGGPWKATRVKANEPSDPYLMTGFNRKRLALSHDSSQPVMMRLEVDITGSGDWVSYRSFQVAPKQILEDEFPASFGAYWLRVVADRDCTATAWLTYE